jgi:hypothetical protein
VAEEISDPDLLTRLLFEPSMRREDRDLIWDSIFQFPSDQGQCESVIWRVKLPDILDVHRIGCEKQVSDRAQGRLRSTYFGSISSTARKIRSIRSTTGAFLAVNHVPEESDAHAHITFSPGANKTDRTHLKLQLRLLFGPLEAHACA